MSRREPRWVASFLRALERTGEARAAAKDAGIDHTTAYARRRAHAEFADRWADALKAHEERVKAEEDAEIAALQRDPSTVHSSVNGPPPPDTLGEDLVMSRGKVRRAGAERWSKRKENIFFDELAATANIGMAAAAAGVSTNAVHARRLRHRLFAAKWDAVESIAKASINMHLIEETKKSFDPATLQTADVKPRVTIDQAIKISQGGGGSRKKQQAAEEAWDGEDDYRYEDEIAGIREKLVRKLQRIRERERPAKLAAGWTYDESYDLMIPPGYIKGPDYKPNEPEPPIDFNARYQ